MDEVTSGHMGGERERRQKYREEKGLEERNKKNSARRRESDGENSFKMGASSCSMPQKKRGKVTSFLLNYTSPSG